MSRDERLGSTHASLYLALFQLWNMKQFQGPVDVNRNVLMRYSKIGSNHTFYKCLNELSEYGYIRYERSFSPSRLSKIYLLNLDSISNQEFSVLNLSRNNQLSEAKFNEPNFEIEPTTCANPAQVECNNDIGSFANPAQVECKNDIATCAKMHTNIKNINIKRLERENEKKRILALTQKKECDDESSLSIPKSHERKKVAQKKESKFKHPELETIIDFFLQNGADSKEGKKFYFHYQSNGWKIGGKSAMNDWQAAALKWILNIEQFKKGIQRKSILNLNKDYGEPL